jgi:cytochrome oxidase Cu insertion factor (SCO1/SenC/PrrC family)
MQQTSRIPSSAVHALAALVSAGGPAVAARDLRDVPIVDQRGTTFTLRELRRPTAVTFVDLYCEDACAVAQAVFGRVAAELARTQVDARLVTLTLSPRIDSPAAMANGARAFRADPARWRWASGSPDDVEALMGAFGVARFGTNYHSAYAYILDARGLPVRSILLSTGADAQVLAALRALPRR